LVKNVKNLKEPKGIVFSFALYLRIIRDNKMILIKVKKEKNSRSHIQLLYAFTRILVVEYIVLNFEFISIHFSKRVYLQNLYILFQPFD